MSKKAKSRQQEKRKKAKHLRKLLNRQTYEERKRLGQNTKSTRAQRFNQKNKKKSMVKHAVHNCGNVGCTRCDPGNIHAILELRSITKDGHENWVWTKRKNR